MVITIRLSVPDTFCNNQKDLKIFAQKEPKKIQKKMHKGIFFA